MGQKLPTPPRQSPVLTAKRKGPLVTLQCPMCKEKEHGYLNELPWTCEWCSELFKKPVKRLNV